MNARDVIVIGSGPAGMSAARHAFDAGLDTVLIDRHEALPVKPQADIAFDGMLQRAGITVSPHIVEHRVKSVHIVPPDGDGMDINLPMIALRRDILDQEMTGPLRTAGGLRLGFWAEQIAPATTGVDVTVLTPEGERQIWRSHCVILATAAGSPLLAAAGIDPQAGLVQSAATIQVEMNCTDLPIENGTIYVGQQAAPGGWCLVMPRGHSRTILRVTARTGQHPIQPYLERLIRRPELRKGLFTGLVEHSATGYNAVAASSANLGQGPVLVAGAAAGQAGLALALAGGRLAAEGVIRAVRLGKPATAARRYARLYWLTYGRLQRERWRGLRILQRLNDSELNRLIALARRIDFSHFMNGGQLRTAPLLLDLFARDPASLAILLRAFRRKPPALILAESDGDSLPEHLHRRFGHQPGTPPYN